MDTSSIVAPTPRPLAAWFAGRIDWASYARMAERLAWEVSEPEGRGPTLVLCELEPLVTIGREGSKSDVLLTDEELRAARLETRFVGRGGGAVVHGPGQLFVALFARLTDLGLASHDVGGYVARLETGLSEALRTVRCGSRRVPAGAGPRGIVGRTGLLAVIGIAVRRGIVCHGAFVNVCPDLALVQHARAAGTGIRGGLPATMGSVEADLQRRVRLQDVRTAVASELTSGFACPRTHVQAGFPLALGGPSRQSLFVTRVG
jgi:lipoyl(octanoyl) transferase